MDAFHDLKRSLFPKGVRRELQNLRSRIFDRCSEEDLTAVFRRLEIPPRAHICVHSMLSGLGYLVGGAETVIRAVQRAVPDCTIMMPSFPFTGTAKDYLERNELFDPLSTPSRSGMLTECLRKMPGAVRSLHPTHACVALGPGAEGLIRGSENSITPFGDNSTYGRFASLPEAYLLLIHTNNTSMLHRMQEMVDMPNLFLPDEFQARTLLPNGTVASYPVKLHTPTLPLFIVEEDERGNKEFIILPEYILLFPGYNYRRMEERLQGNAVWEKLWKRHNFFIERGIYRIARHGESEIMSVKLAPWLKEVNSDILSSLKRFPLEYDARNLAALNEAGRLTR